VQPVQAESLTDLLQFPDEPVDGPQAQIAGPVGAAAAQLVIEDDPAAVGQRFQRLQVVVREAGTAMQAQQRGGIGVLAANRAVEDLAVGELQVALFGTHAAPSPATDSAGGSASSEKTFFISGSRSGCRA
jgi:hypothetical protein